MADITQRGQLTRDDSYFPLGWKFYYSSGTGPTVVKGTPGFLHSITLNKPIAANIVSLYDSVSTQTGTIATIVCPASPSPVTLTYDITLTNGLVVSAGTTANDFTISYL